MTRPRRRVRWIVGAVVVVVILAVAGPFVYIHFVEGSAPAKLTLPDGSTTNTSARDSASAPASVPGDWNVGPGSVVGYRVGEELLGQHATAVGRTSQVWGGLTISGTAVTSGSFTVNMASVVSDQSQRNAQFDGRIMDVSTFPTATLELTKPIALSPLPPIGATTKFSATGNLTMHGVTKKLTFTLSAERLGSSLAVLSDIPIVFADWNIANPSIGGFVTTQTSGTLEVLLELTKGNGNAPTSGSGSSNTPGGGGPITVPAITTPPLTVPNR